MIYWDIYYIPWDKLLLKDPTKHKEWMIIAAHDKGSAKEAGKKEGMVTEVSCLNKYKKNRMFQ